MDEAVIHAVSLVVYADGHFLLVRRGRPPAEGLFAFPGGRVETGETAEEAVLRELHEETGLVADKISLLREMVLDGDGGRRYRLEVFTALEAHGFLCAGDDANHAGWYALDEMRRLPVTASTLAVAEELTARGNPCA
ncbi:NUDIX hydrolase [Chelativorans sp. YIM 93263]|uniref:NUDIX hydrolase n=1 Tax=Chelativorans sp. YIM 93263 TaxID=2906648 RepID=UPI002379ED5A|nr:NUDIX domain-containing protein [Chelativorans sp. YIM 93263]